MWGLRVAAVEEVGGRINVKRSLKNAGYCAG